MQNKKHNIIDDAWEMREELMGGAEHTFRVGMIINTVINSIPVVIPDISKLVPESFSIDFNNLSEFQPTLLNVSHKDMQLAILVLVDKDSNHIQCYPFSNLTEGGQWWVYEVAFDLTPDNRIEIRPVHPLVNHADPTQEMMVHLETLATICSAYVYRTQQGEIELVESQDDFSKLNKKRVKHGKTPLENNRIPNYVRRDVGRERLQSQQDSEVGAVQS